MHIAVEKKNIEIIKLLLQRKEINVDIKDEILTFFFIKFILKINDFIR